MSKVFIYLYIFLESVLCKTWFCLFAHRGEVGAAVLMAVGVAARLSRGLEGPGSLLTGEAHPESGTRVGLKQPFVSHPLPVSATPAHPRPIYQPRNCCKGCSGDRRCFLAYPQSWLSRGGCRHSLWSFLLHSILQTARCFPGGRRGDDVESWPPALLWWEQASSFEQHLFTWPPGPTPPLWVQFQRPLLRGWHSRSWTLQESHLRGASPPQEPKRIS